MVFLALNILLVQRRQMQLVAYSAYMHMATFHCQWCVLLLSDTFVYYFILLSISIITFVLIVYFPKK